MHPLGRPALLLALSVVAAACTGGNGATATGSSPPSASPGRTSTSPSPSENPYVAFTSRGGDAFAWSEHVRGTADCDDLAVLVNGSASTATIDRQGSAFGTDVDLAPGTNEVVARCTGPNGESEESLPLTWDERLRPGPVAEIHVSTNGDTVILDGRSSRPGPPNDAKVVSYAWHEDPRHPAQLRRTSGGRLGRASGPRLELRAPTKDGEYYVSFTVADADGRRDTATTYFVVNGGVPRPVDMMHEHPSWIDRAVIYAPIPILWGNGGPRALDRRLPYLKRLGVDALWLWPPAEQRAYGEEYAITDYFQLDPSWGPPSAFKQMVDDAHALGMHVLLDIVPNHMSDQSPYFQDAQKYGKASHYYDFFDRDANGDPTHYFDWTNLPNLNYDNPEVRAMITEAFVHWVRDDGIDGFRVDAAWGVERRRPSFWPELRRAVKRVDPDVLMLAEASAVDPYYFSHGFDVAYDWTNHPGQWAWTSAFDFPQDTGALLAPAITNAPKGYAADALVLRFINNNDTGIRFVDQYGPKLTKVAATLMFTVPGVPAMFAGDEIGASYEPYSNLTPIDWKDRYGLLPLYRRLISLKHTLPALHANRIDMLTASADSVLAYLRPGNDPSSSLLVLLNFGSKQPALSITNTPELASFVGRGSMRDLLTNRPIHLRVDPKAVSFPMPATSALVLVPGGR